MVHIRKSLESLQILMVLSSSQDIMKCMTMRMM